MYHSVEGSKETDQITMKFRKTWSWWRHQMETFSALLAFCVGNSPVTGEFPSQGQRRGALMFCLFCAWCFVCSAPWITRCVNNLETGELRRHRAHYDVILMAASVALCEGNSPVPVDSPEDVSVTFDCRHSLNNLSKKTLTLSVIWHVIAPMWPKCNNWNSI